LKNTPSPIGNTPLIEGNYMKSKVSVFEQKEYNLQEIESHLRPVFTDPNISDKLLKMKVVLVKPNMLGAFAPERAVTTHPVVLESVIRILQDMGVGVVVGDSPGGTVKAQTVWDVCGYSEVCSRYNVPLLDFGKHGILSIHSGELKLYFDKNVWECHGLINLAKLKTHSMAVYTGAVKNLYGTIPGLYKAELHKLYPSPNEFAKVLTTIYYLLKPKIILNIIDGIIGMDGQGPSAGRPYPFGVLVASENSVAADIVASEIMGFRLDEILYLQQCFEHEDFTLSELDLQNERTDTKYQNLNIETVLFRNRFLNRLPRFIKTIVTSLFSYKPGFRATCTLCGVCVNSCPTKALSIVRQKVRFDNHKCIKCLCCHEMCPSSAVYLKKNIVARMVFKSDKGQVTRDK